jgi:hypothetical protein
MYPLFPVRIRDDLDASFLDGKSLGEAMGCDTRVQRKELLWRGGVTWSVHSLVSIAYPHTSSSGDASFDPRNSIGTFSFDFWIPTSPDPPALRCFSISPRVDINIKGDLVLFSIVESNQVGRE